MIGSRPRRAVPATVVAALIAIGGTTVAVVGAAAVLRQAAPADRTHRTDDHPTASDTDERFRSRSPVTVPPRPTLAQQRYDQALRDGLGGLAGMEAAAGLSVPPPAITGGWPALEVDFTPDGWARKFVQGLLDIDYTHHDRAALGAWLQAHVAPELLPGVPTAAADKILYVSVLRSELFGGQATPIPAATEWRDNADAGVRQWVSNLVTRPDAEWDQMVAAGWQPSDPRMTTVDVHGMLTVQRDGEITSKPFSLQLLLGSARWRDGYGTVAVSDWQVS